MNALRTSILFLMLYLIFAREITVGQFFSLWIYSFFIFGPLQELGNVINVYREAEEQPPRDLRAAAVRDPQSVEIRGFGSFRFRNRAPRKGRNPKTGEKVDVPSKKIPYFKMGKELKALLNGKGAAEEALTQNPNPES